MKWLKRLLKRWLGVVDVPGNVPDAPERLDQGATLPEIVGQLNRVSQELADLRLEWTEVLDKMTAWASRQAARDRARFRKSMGEMEEDAPVAALPGRVTPPSPEEPEHPPTLSKTDLYRRVAALRGNGK